jgi:hypothetical protein
VKKVKHLEVEFVMRRGNKSNRGSNAYDWMMITIIMIMVIIKIIIKIQFLPQREHCS